ncbi:MAG: alpha/beta hydrolase [Myxococcota bacterium]|nr:alpha/beta hydrolase [Myxococcota bacterium]
MDTTAAFVAAERRVFEDYGLQASERHLDLRDPPLRARVLEAGSGAPVLLVHGGGGFASQWTSLMAALPGRRSLAVDRPGCGLSEPFDYGGVDLRRHAVSFLGSVLDELGIERVPIVANSMGATWSIFFAVACPERVSALALLGCPALFPGTGAPPWLRAMASPRLGRLLVRLRPPPAGGMRSFLARMLGERAAAAMTDAEVQSMMLAQGIPGARESFGSLLGRVLTWRGARRGAGISRDELRRLEMPTLLVWGREDGFGSVAAAQRGVALLPQGRLEVVEGGHQPWCNEPERCAALVSEFLPG